MEQNELPDVTPYKEKEPLRKLNVNSSSSQTRASARCTRSQAAPDWTSHETLVLVSEFASVNEDWLKELSSYQKWKMISDNCLASDVIRSSYQCKNRWESLLVDYNKISEWESRYGEGSYWSLDSEKKKLLGLPIKFDQDVFGFMGAVIKPQEDCAGDVNSDSENLIATADDPEVSIVKSDTEIVFADYDTGLEKLRGKTDKARDMSAKLQEDAKKIHAILRGELDDGPAHNLPLDMMKPSSVEIEFTRRQADQLIKALGGLAGTLNQFSELIMAGQCEGISPIKSTAP